MSPHFESEEFTEIVTDVIGDHIARITLSRPERMNGYTTRMAEELVAAIDGFARRDDLRALIITGAGRGFCAGGDVKSQVEIDMADSRTLGHAVVMREGFHRLTRLMRQLDKPTIAAVNGPAVAGGFSLALLCDFRIASRRATFGDPSGTVGLLPDEGGAWLFQRVMGTERAMRMTLLGESLSADEALRYAVVGEVVDHEDLESAAVDLAARLAARSPLTVRVAKRLIVQAQESTMSQALDQAEFAVMLTNDSDDFREGLAAFNEKRTPRFTGR